MASFSAVWSPKSQTGGINDSQCTTATTSTQILVGVRQTILITTTIATAIRFSSGATTTVTGDFNLPAGSVYFTTGDEFDRITVLQSGAGTACVMRLSV